MPVVVYNIDNQIAAFFQEAGASLSRQQCDEFARQIYGAEILPVDIQGMTSYTIVAGASGRKIVQFREQSALLDVDMMALAKQVHGDVVPSCSELGRIGDLDGALLVAYEMERLPGAAYIVARPSLTELDSRLNLVHSLASFFASSWQKGTPSTPGLVDMSAVRTECVQRLTYLGKTLPERFSPAIDEVQAGLAALLDGSYPVVLTHSDLNEMNILVDPNDGKISGVVDWPSLSFLPFGFSLYALENALGVMNYDGWKWFDDSSAIRDAFWVSFVEKTGASASQVNLAKQAAKAGILVRYGTAYNSGFQGMVGVRDPDQPNDFGYLDALLL